MSWLYCHHGTEPIKHKIIQGTASSDKFRENITVKSKRKAAPFFNCSTGHYYTWSYLYVMDLNTGREHYWEEDNESKDQVQPWIFDPLLRAIKVAELTKKQRKRRRLTRLNKVVKLPKQNRKTGKK